MTSKLLLTLPAALCVAACSGSGGNTPADTDTGTDGGGCEPGATNECACDDGSPGTQVCAEDGMSYGACECDGGTTTTAGSSSGPGTSAGTSDSGSGTTGASATGTTTGSSGGTSTATDSGGSTGGQVGEIPTAKINHPGQGEDRKAGTPIPFIGVANDAEDGELSGASMRWYSDQEGMIGSGQSFDNSLTTLGPHVITLEAEDSDQNIGMDQITINIVP